MEKEIENRNYSGVHTQTSSPKYTLIYSFNTFNRQFKAVILFIYFAILHEFELKISLTSYYSADLGAILPKLVHIES